MAPKKSAGSSKAENTTQKKLTSSAPYLQDKDQPPKPKIEKQNVKKRKNTAANDGPQKASRRSGRSAPKSQATTQDLLKYLLSPSAEELCRPEDETAAVKDKHIRTYSSAVLTPFEELLSAVILSRPISHRLGLRTIRTVLNDPYYFTTAKKVQEAGQEKHFKAVWDARTQHKAKTAEQIGLIGSVVLAEFTTNGDKDGTQLSKVREMAGKDVEKEREILKDKIKGLGKTGLDIFCRRVQWLWDESYPFVDGRTEQALHRMGLPTEAEDLQKLVEQHWNTFDTKHLTGDDASAKKRRAFVIVLERATSADLEGKTEALLEAAATTAA
jgi:hypothetical protein